MAFVLLQHLSPDHPSMLPELVQRYTKLRVLTAEDGMSVQVGCVYVTPPNRDITLSKGTLHLVESAGQRGHRLPIDAFFRSLAEDQEENAIAIVLSGTGSDGTLGARAVKDAGGLVVAQSPDSCEFDGMPRSVIASGVVDFELPPAEMVPHLVAYVLRAFRVALGSGSDAAERPLKKIFEYLRAQTGHDFSQYKPKTTLRRIDRRMAVHQLDSLESYAKYLAQTPAEAMALFHDLLIGVTRFFRDPETFEAIEKDVIPRLFNGKPPGSAIRVWSVGCSSGEEAYSLAILLQEHLETLSARYTLQVFATDLDPRSIAVARAGVYPASIADEVSPGRLARYFVPRPDGAGYRIHKTVRDLVVFSEHDVLRDPPFSRLDMISCRNLLIYLGPELQRRVLPNFHYALNPGGSTLVLGTSESVGECADLFTHRDGKARLYQRQDLEPSAHWAIKTRVRGRSAAYVPSQATPRAVPLAAAKLSAREVAERAILGHTVPFAALVNERGDIVYLHGRGGMFLEPASGEAAAPNILTMARDGLRSELGRALRSAVSSGVATIERSPSVRTNGHHIPVDVGVQPVESDSSAPNSPPLFLVTLCEARPEPAKPPSPIAMLPAAPATVDADARVAELTRELQVQHESLVAANTDLANSYEELQSTNEEMQSVNEELQSSNEELETSKEELQSVNEELTTINAELQARVADLAQASGDMVNLLASTGIATLFVGHDLCIRRFTPAATRLINLIPSDAGRPLAHIASNLHNYDSLVADTTAVLETLVPRNVEVRAHDGAWYTMRILPYRTLDNIIEGAVITFMDISEIVRTREMLAAANRPNRLAVVVRDSHDAITVHDLEGRIIAWNPGAERVYGWTEAEALLLHDRDRIPDGIRSRESQHVRRMSEEHLPQPYLTQRRTKSGDLVNVCITASALQDPAGRTYAIATTERVVPEPPPGGLHGQKTE